MNDPTTLRPKSLSNFPGWPAYTVFASPSLLKLIKFEGVHGRPKDGAFMILYQDKQFYLRF